MKINILKISLLMIILLQMKVFAETEIIINDSSVSVGSSRSIMLPILAKLDVQSADSIRLLLEYDARMLNISEVYGGDSCVILSPHPMVIKHFPTGKLDSAVIEISDTLINSNGNLRFCTLKVEGLAGSETLAYIKPAALYINGIEVSGAFFRTGVINVIGAPAPDYIVEGIGVNYPNPFIERTLFPFAIHSPSKAEFLIYSLEGVQTESSSDQPVYFDFKIYKSTGLSPGEEINDFANYDYQPGYYYLELFPSYQFAPSGSYLIVMKTTAGSYSVSFIYYK